MHTLIETYSTFPTNSLEQTDLASHPGVRHNASGCWCRSREVRVGVFLCCWQDFRCKQLLLSVAMNTCWACLDGINPRSVAPTKGGSMFEAIVIPLCYEAFCADKMYSDKMFYGEGMWPKL